MPQFLQQIPWVPMLQGFIVTALSNAVSMPSSWDRWIICRVATSIDAATGSAHFFSLVWAAFCSSAI
jgi:hypothetical protein